MTRLIKISLALLAVVVTVLAVALNARPQLAPQSAQLKQSNNAQQLTVTWLGVSTLLITDGNTSLLTDGFFTRPNLASVAALKLAPNKPLIDQSLARAGATNLAAVIVLHSHYDHVMDSPYIAEKTGALLVGSESTANVGRGWGLEETQIRVAKNRQTFTWGDFTVTLIENRHFPHGAAMGNIIQPLQLPAHSSAYKEGGSYSVIIEHQDKRILVQGSAGFMPNALAGIQADVVYLGVGMLGKAEPLYQQQYWQETVGITNAKRVIPIHWDDFLKPLNQPPRPFPYLFDDFAGTMEFLNQQAASSSVEIMLPTTWEAVYPFPTP